MNTKVNISLICTRADIEVAAYSDMLVMMEDVDVTMLLKSVTRKFTPKELLGQYDSEAIMEWMNND